MILGGKHVSVASAEINRRSLIGPPFTYANLPHHPTTTSIPLVQPHIPLLLPNGLQQTLHRITINHPWAASTYRPAEQPRVVPAACLYIRGPLPPAPATNTRAARIAIGLSSSHRPSPGSGDADAGSRCDPTCARP